MVQKSADPDIRWKQRLSHFHNALRQLDEAVSLSQQRSLSKLEKQGLIQAFEFTHELAWNVMRDFFIYQGNTNIMGSRDATREAFQKGLIGNGDTWMKMIQSRNLSLHTYHEEVAAKIVTAIVSDYATLFHDFAKRMDSLK